MTSTKRKRGNVYITLRPGNIRYTQDTIANTMHVTNSEGNVMKMPLGEVVDKVLGGDINIEAIPKISVFCLRNTWFSLDNRRLWVFKKLQNVFDNSKNTRFSITCLERDFECVNWSKITTSNGGEDILVRRDPGGTKWREIEASFTNKYLRTLKKPTGIVRTITMGTLKFPYNAGKSSFDAPVTKSYVDPPNNWNTVPAYNPRLPRLLSHPDYLDMFPPSKPYFHGEDYVPEVNDEWYWREADRYHTHKDNVSFQPSENMACDFRFPKHLDVINKPRRSVRGRRRHVDEEGNKDIFGWLYRDY